VSSVEKPQPGARCQRCDVVVEACFFCEREECPDKLCYRCVRIALGQEVPEPHRHGG
jgi:hypothetical protein